MQAEEAVNVVKEQLDLAMRGSNLGIWDVALTPGSDYRRVYSGSKKHRDDDTGVQRNRSADGHSSRQPAPSSSA